VAGNYFRFISTDTKKPNAFARNFNLFDLPHALKAGIGGIQLQICGASIDDDSLRKLSKFPSRVGALDPVTHN
jgi:hypothetical protein